MEGLASMKLIVFTYLTLFLLKTASNHQDIARRPAQISRAATKVWVAKYVRFLVVEAARFGD